TASSLNRPTYALGAATAATGPTQNNHPAIRAEIHTVIAMPLRMLASLEISILRCCERVAARIEPCGIKFSRLGGGTRRRSVAPVPRPLVRHRAWRQAGAPARRGVAALSSVMRRKPRWESQGSTVPFYPPDNTT